MVEMNIINVDDLLNASELIPTVRSVGVPLFNILDSMRLLDLCESMSVGILGIEGFYLKGDDLCPDMEFIADFSAILSRDFFEIESIKSARVFLAMAEGKFDLLFEYVLAKRNH